MKILVIDGQGGGLGKQLVAALSAQCPQAQLTAVGTNSLAASAMRKAGAVRTATGENAVVVNCRHADIIVGPIGIVIADALLGEITPAMAAAVCQSGAKRVLIPVNHCDNYIVGVPEQPIGDLVAAAVQKVTCAAAAPADLRKLKRQHPPGGFCSSRRPGGCFCVDGCSDEAVVGAKGHGVKIGRHRHGGLGHGKVVVQVRFGAVDVKKDDPGFAHREAPLRLVWGRQAGRCLPAPVQ